MNRRRMMMGRGTIWIEYSEGPEIANSCWFEVSGKEFSESGKYSVKRGEIITFFAKRGSYRGANFLFNGEAFSPSRDDLGTYSFPIEAKRNLVITASSKGTVLDVVINEV